MLRLAKGSSEGTPKGFNTLSKLERPFCANIDPLIKEKEMDLDTVFMYTWHTSGFFWEDGCDLMSLRFDLCSRSFIRFFAVSYQCSINVLQKLSHSNCWCVPWREKNKTKNQPEKQQWQNPKQAPYFSMESQILWNAPYVSLFWFMLQCYSSLLCGLCCEFGHSAVHAVRKDMWPHVSMGSSDGEEETLKIFRELTENIPTP